MSGRAARLASRLGVLLLIVAAVYIGGHVLAAVLGMTPAEFFIRLVGLAFFGAGLLVGLFWLWLAAATITGSKYR
jgi:hypothetical protein